MPYDEIAADLPPPADDEPASLRQDLLDELADHLACAMARETQLEQVVRQDPGSTAWSRVVARFGDPRAVMFRLWRDAMWERLMMQRVVSWMMIVTLGALCLGMVFVVRSVNQQQLAMAQQQQAMALQQQEIAATLQRISEQSAREAAASKTAASIEWVPVELTLAARDPAKILPAGFKVRLQPQGEATSIPPWEANSDESSKVRFPVVHYGRYILAVDAPWGEYTGREIVVSPGTPLQMTVLCPDSPPEPLTVQPELVLPDDLKPRSLHVQLSLGDVHRDVNDWIWGGSRLEKGRSASVLIGADHQLRAISEANAAAVRESLVYSEEGLLEGIRWRGAALRPYSYVHFHITQDFPDRDQRIHYLIKPSFEVDREVRFEVLVPEGKLRLEPTEAGLQKLRELLTQFDQMVKQGGNGVTDIATPYQSGVPLPPFPTERPE